jgi:ribosomal protein L35AE/L33A
MTKASRKVVSERIKSQLADKREQERLAAEKNIIAMTDVNTKDKKLKTESVYHLGNQVISVYSSEGRVTRFIFNDADNNSFETTIEEA